MTLLEFKSLVKEWFKASPECECLGHAYDHWARQFGFKDWNTMRALYPWR